MCGVQRTTWRIWLSPSALESWRLNSAHQLWWKVPSPSESSCWLCLFFFFFSLFIFSFLKVVFLEFHVMRFEHIHPPPFSIPLESTFPSLSTQRIVSSFLFNPANVICAASIVGGVAFHYSVIDLPEATFLKKTDFLSLSSYQLPIDFHLEGESLCSSPLAQLRFCLAWVCAVFFCILPHYCAFSCTTARLCACSIKDWMSSLLFFAPWPAVSLCINCIMLMRVDRYTN